MNTTVIFRFDNHDEAVKLFNYLKHNDFDCSFIAEHPGITVEGNKDLIRELSYCLDHRNWESGST